MYIGFGNRIPSSFFKLENVMPIKLNFGGMGIFWTDDSSSSNRNYCKLMLRLQLKLNKFDAKLIIFHYNLPIF